MAWPEPRDAVERTAPTARPMAHPRATARARELQSILTNTGPSPVRPLLVYFIATASGSAIKIGQTDDIAKRLIALQVGHHETLSVVALLPADWSTERVVHDHFRASLIRGEWFRPTADLLEFIRLLNEARGST